jgi:hypothetical protein
MPLSAIRRAPRNPKLHDANGIRASLARFGVADLPVLDERTGQLVSGHGRLDQFHYLAALSPAELEELTGRPGLPGGVRVDPVSGEWLLPVARGWASANDAEAEAYLVAANSLTMFGGWDDQALVDLLTELGETDPTLLTVTGYGADDLSTLLTNVGVGAGQGAGGGDRQPPEDFPEYDEAIPVEHTCPACGYQFSGGKTVPAGGG